MDKLRPVEDQADKMKGEFEDAPTDHILSLDDLLSSQSDALNRIARDPDDGFVTTAHTSFSSGHRSSGSHASHSSASQIEHPLA